MKTKREEQIDYIIKYMITLPHINYNEYWDKEIFQQKVYSIWATQELLNDINNQPTCSVLSIIEKFINRMDEYSLKNKKTSLMFSIAYDTAMDIYDKLLLLNDGICIERF